MVKKVGKYELGRTLGEGTFGKVKYAINTETNEAVAIKVLDKESIQRQNMGNQIKKEISIMKMVNHKHVVSLIEVLASKAKIFIVLELVTGGELFDKIVSSKRLDEEQARFYFRQLVDGVEYCHKLGVCHRDLKPENLLLDEHGNLKISDFGLSSLYVGDADGDGASRTQLLHTTCGTPNYVAPEVLSDQGYDGKKADVWSIGVILYVLLAGFLPFDESTIANLFNKIKKAEFTYPSWFSTEVKSVIDVMLVADPKARISLTQLKDHPWLNATGLTPRPENTKSNVLTATTEAVIVPPLGDLSLGEEKRVDADDAEDEDDDDEIRAKSSTGKPIPLNAFNLVPKAGGFLLDRLFSPDKFATIEPSHGTTAATATASTMTNDGAGILKYGMNKRMNSHKFTSHTSPPEELMKQVYIVFTTKGFMLQPLLEDACATGKAKGSILTAKGSVGVDIRVYELCSTLNLLEFKKGKGDLLEWDNIYKDIFEKLQPFINTPVQLT